MLFYLGFQHHHILLLLLLSTFRMQELEIDESLLLPVAVTTSAITLSYLMYRHATSAPSTRPLPPGEWVSL